MKIKLFWMGYLFPVFSAFSQVAGNVNHQYQVYYSDNNINVAVPYTDEVVLSVKGLANVKADSYVAVFNLSQTGKTTTEVNELIGKRINAVLEKIKGKTGVTAYVDMLTFVPLYEYEVEKKMFSKKTYNEVPKGFELKKNIHVEYKDPAFLNDLIAWCAEYEIYDLVKVDYFSSALEAIRKEIVAKAKLQLKEKQKNYQDLIGVEFVEWEKQLTDGFVIKYPTEMYKNYQVYSNSSIFGQKQGAEVKPLEKTVTLYYQPVYDKEFDFVLNPKVLEPVIQVMYEVKLRLYKKKKEDPKQEKDVQGIQKQFFIVTPNGDVKPLDTK